MFFFFLLVAVFGLDSYEGSQSILKGGDQIVS
jgi:hypothetical protein